MYICYQQLADTVRIIKTLKQQIMTPVIEYEPGMYPLLSTNSIRPYTRQESTLIRLVRTLHCKIQGTYTISKLRQLHGRLTNSLIPIGYQAVVDRVDDVL